MKGPEIRPSVIEDMDAVAFDATCRRVLDPRTGAHFLRQTRAEAPRRGVLSR